MDLHRHSMREANAIAPIPAADRDEAHLRRDDTAADGSGHLLGALGPEADVPALVADKDVADEAVPLARGRHLLDGVDLQDLVLQGAWLEELVNDLVLLDGQGVQVDVLDARDLLTLHQAAELRHGGPLLLLALALALPLLALAALAEAALTHLAGLCYNHRSASSRLLKPTQQ